MSWAFCQPPRGSDSVGTGIIIRSETVLFIVIQKSAPPIDGMWTRKLGDHYSRGQTSEAAVSVTATVLNEADDIDRLLTSLMEQTLSPAEVIIVDGGSTDGTWERLQAGRSKYPN